MHYPSGGRPLDEMKRVSRILEIVQMISTSPERYLRKDLASRFEISDRMIQKDLDVIRHGLKLTLIHTRSGYYFEDTPRLPAVQYSFSEALALLMAMQAARQVSGIGSAELAAATVRLEALFPAEFAPYLHQMGSQPPMNAHREHRQKMLQLLNLAMIQNRKVEIVYATGSRGGAVSQRIVHPYHIMPYVRSWQLIAYCEKRCNTIMFKIDRIHEATMLDAKFVVAPGFDPESYIGNVWGVIRGEGLEPEVVVLQFEADAGRWVAEEYWHSSQQVENLADGRVIFRLHLPITPEFTNWLLYYGSRVEVLDPGWLREQVAAEHRAAAGVYQERYSNQEVETDA